VYGSRFRACDPDDARRGLLGQASILTVTSYPNRTSPVERGKWILTNLLGVPPQPPPPNVRRCRTTADGACCRCASGWNAIARRDVRGLPPVMDPIGFAHRELRRIGRWRDKEDGRRSTPRDAVHRRGRGRRGALRREIAKRPEVFVGVITEKMLTYALGRGLEYYDMPAVRKIVSDAQASDYRFSSIVLGVARSVPFQMKETHRHGSKETR
jgi:hypothetical protein